MFPDFIEKFLFSLTGSLVTMLLTKLQTLHNNRIKKCVLLVDLITLFRIKPTKTYNLTRNAGLFEMVY